MEIINNSKFNFISVPEIEIVDERDKPVKEKFYKGGSTIELKCIVKQIVGQAPEYIIWHHGNRMLNYDIERGGIRYYYTMTLKECCNTIVYLYHLKSWSN